MPKPVSKQDREIAAAVAAREEFLSGWARSRKGNLWREWGGATLTVFPRKDRSTFGWCIACSDGETSFSETDFDTAEDAMTALWDTLNGF